MIRLIQTSTEILEDPRGAIVSETSRDPIGLRIAPGRDLLRPARRLQIVLTALLLVLGYALIYPLQVDLSGDQTAQVVATQSLLENGTYRVSLHEAYGSSTVVTIGDDLRQPLRWFPPGYSILLFVFAKCGLSLPQAALILYYGSKFLWALSWLAACSALGVSFSSSVCAVSFLFFLTYPSTTTDLFESIAVALVFVAIASYSGAWTGSAIACLSLSAGILIRFATAKLTGFYALIEFLRRPSHATVTRLGLSLAPVAGIYFFCTRVLGGEWSPYHNAGPAPHTAWQLLPKGIYYAATGGWSPSNLALKIALLAFLGVAAIGMARLYRNNALPSWVRLLVSWQSFCLLFLIVVQLRYGSMYAPGEPAFATPRFYTLAQPLNVAALLLLVEFGLPVRGSRLRNPTALLLLLCAIDWVAANHRILRDRVAGSDGFLRPTDLAGVHRVLQSQHLDAIFNDAGVFTYTAADARIIYPADVRGLRAPKDCRVAVVRFAGDPSPLVERLDKLTGSGQAQRIGTFEIVFFNLPKGIEVNL